MQEEQKTKVQALKERYNLGDSHFWELHQKQIITHDACMIIAEKEGIIFDTPEIVVNHEDQGVALLGYGTLLADENNDRESDLRVWTFGEAFPKNCKVNFFWAMAEKRLKDRLTLMLIGAYHLGFYSEDEADGFRQKEVIDKQGTIGEDQKYPKPASNEYRVVPNTAGQKPSQKQINYAQMLITEKIPEESQHDMRERLLAGDKYEVSIIIDDLLKM